MSAALRAAVRREGGLLAAALGPAPFERADAPAAPAARAADGPRAAEARDAYALLVEAIHEGHLLHTGRPRVVTAAEPDLALLAGDRLFALGLERLARLGDLEAIAELADVISLCAQAGASGDLDLADAAWEAGATAVGWGAGAEQRAAKEAARTGENGAGALLRAASKGQSGAVTGLDDARG